MAKFNNSNSNNKNEIFKTSGAKYTDIKKEGIFQGFPIVSAWKLAKGGLITAKCYPRALKNSNKVAFEVDVENKFTKKLETKIYARYRVDVKQGINVKTYYCFMNMETKKLVINELGLVITDQKSQYKTRSGKVVHGYFGKCYKK